MTSRVTELGKANWVSTKPAKRLSYAVPTTRERSPIDESPEVSPVRFQTIRI